MPKKITLIVSEFNSELTSRMQTKAEEVSKELNLEVSKIIKVPGVYEIPYAAKQTIDKKETDCIAALGVIIQGKTDHDVIIGRCVAQSLMDLSVYNKTPIGFGIIGPRVSREEADQRAEEYAERAVKAAHALLL